MRVDKIVNQGGYDMDPPIMIITACIGLCCNIINLIALGDCSCKEDDEDDENMALINSITSVFKPNPLYYSKYQPRKKKQNIRLNTPESPKEGPVQLKLQRESTMGTE